MTGLTKSAARKRLSTLRRKAGANRRVSAASYDGLQATQRMRDAYWQGLMREVDPEHALSDEARLRKAKRLWAARMQEGKASKLQKRLRSLKAG